MSASPPSWMTGDSYPPYQATLQQAAGASAIPLTAASQVQFIARTTGASMGGSTTRLVLKGAMTIASAAAGMVTYNWGASDLAIADVYQAQYEINWQTGGNETVPNDSYDQFWVFNSLDGGA